MGVAFRSMMIDPDFPVPILKDVRNPPSFVFVQDQSVLDEMSQAGIRSDPQASISGAKQGQDAEGRQFFSGLGSHRTKRTPSNLKSPASVPAQR